MIKGRARKAGYPTGIAAQAPPRRLYALPGEVTPLATASGSGTALPAPLRESAISGATPAHARMAAERLGTLFRLFNYMHRAGVLGADGTLDRLEVQNAMHKYAYVAKRLGVPLDYEFEFMENGAYSGEIFMDIYYRGCAAGGVEPFAGDQDASGTFARLVGDRGAEWLHLTTFALDERHAGESRDGFVARVRRANPEYGKDLAGEVFDHVSACLGEGAGRN